MNDFEMDFFYAFFLCFFPYLFVSSSICFHRSFVVWNLTRMKNIQIGKFYAEKKVSFFHFLPLALVLCLHFRCLFTQEQELSTTMLANMFYARWSYESNVFVCNDKKSIIETGNMNWIESFVFILLHLSHSLDCN